MKNYVAGFLFNDTGTMVTVIEKKKFPDGFDWTNNPLNAVGGKIESGEAADQAMAREFEEEAGVKTKRTDWEQFLLLESSSWSVAFFRCFSSQYMSQTKTMEEERILEIATNPLIRTVPNLKWIIPMALREEIVFARVQEKV
jgi:8-oxo-dGTP diphosphatase